MQAITYNELKENHGLSNEQIQKLDRRAQMVFGNTLMMIDGCLRSKESSEDKISTSLIYVSMAMEMLENNLLESISESIPKDELNLTEKGDHMLGAIVGDVLGSIHEFRPVKTKDFELLNSDCIFTDDTVMTVAVADSLMNGTPYIESLQMWGNSYPTAGYGGMFSKWLQSDFPEPYNSFGNGSAMRSSSIGWLFDDQDSVLKEAKKSAEITHNHPEGIKGAQSIALGLMLGRQGKTKKEIKELLENLFDYDLSQSLDEIRPSYSHDVSCQGSVPQAIISFLESEDFEDAIRNAISLGGDADTQACIAGALAEGYYKKIPDQIEGFVLNKMTPDIFAIINQFKKKIRIVLN